MTSREYQEYDRLTEDMEADFLILTAKFMEYCEKIIFGEDFPEIKYYCFHLYNDNYSSQTFQRLSYRIDKLLIQTDAKKFPNLANGLTDLLIYLKEPIAREKDQLYRAENYLWWKNAVIADPQLAYSSSFRKYLQIL